MAWLINYDIRAPRRLKHVQTLRFLVDLVWLRIGNVYIYFGAFWSKEAEQNRTNENNGAKQFKSVLPCNVF